MKVAAMPCRRNSLTVVADILWKDIPDSSNWERRAGVESSLRKTEMQRWENEVE